MMSKIHTTIHDHFIRAILSDKRIAIDYFENYLPSYVSDKLDFSTLTQSTDTYLSEQLRKSISDIVYVCEKKDSKEHIKICLLIEHKSYPDQYTPIQIGGYIFSGLQKQIENKEELSMIIPVLLYHGKGKWKYQTLSSTFKKLEPAWRHYLPDFDYVYNNLGDITDEQVEILNNKFLVASLLALKHSFQKDWLEINAQRILILAQEASEKLQKNLIIYLFSNSSLQEEQILEIIESLPLILKETIMSTLDILIEKGIEKGIEKAKTDVVKNLLLNTDFSSSKIAALTGISEALVNNVKAILDTKK